MSAIVRASLKIDYVEKPASLDFLGDAEVVSVREFHDQDRICAHVRFEMDWGDIEENLSLESLVTRHLDSVEVDEEQLLDGTISCISAHVEKCLGCGEEPYDDGYRWECACTQEQRGAA